MVLLNYLLLFLFFLSPLWAEEKEIDKILRISSSLLNGDTVFIQEVYGGLTNSNYKVCIDSSSYFIRYSNSHNQLLGASLEREWQCSSLAAKIGLCPKVILYIPAEKILISEFIETDEQNIDLKHAATQQKFCSLIRSLHQMDDRFPTVFCPFESLYQFAKNAEEAGAFLPAVIFETIFPQIDQLKSQALHLKAVPCHLDLHHGNVLDDGKKMWLIDWEYAAMSDPFLDLATLSATEFFSDEEMIQLLQSYLNGSTPTDKELKHLFMMRILADARWMLWCYLQAKISPRNSAFATYGELYLEQCLNRLKTFF
jgi:thiamine kinase-like enzyme